MPTAIGTPGELRLGTADGQTVLMSDFIFQTVSSPNFINALIPALTLALQTSIKTLVEHSINNAIQSTIAPLITKIESQDRIIAEQRNEIANLVAQVDSLSTKFQSIEYAVEEQEQYSRRTCLRFHNIPPTVTDTDQEVIDICKNHLKIDISTADIGRSHFVGKANLAGKRQIIVRFLSYRKRALVYTHKRRLKNNPRKIFISEDLTMYRRSIVNSLIDLQKNKVIHAFWTNDGRIFARKDADVGPKIMIKSHEDVEALKR